MSTQDYQGWRMEAPVISTGHIEQATAEALSKGAYDLQTIPYPEGVLVRFDPEYDDMEALPEGLQKCLRWALDNEFCWIRFDCDGDVVSELPLFKW